MFKELVQADGLVVKEEADDWKEAVRHACAPLVAHGSVPCEYSDEVVKSVEELGPYIFLAPHIAMPHVQLDGKTDLDVAVLKLNHPVVYDDNHEAQLFVAFSARDGQSHIEMIQELATFLIKEKNVDALLKAKCESDIYQYIKTNG